MIVDDHPVVREAICLAVKANWPAITISEAGTLAEAEIATQRSPPVNLVVLDLALPDAKGYAALVLLQKLLPEAPIVVLSAMRDPNAAASTYLLGAAGYLTKSTPLSEVAATLKKVADGERHFPAQAAQNSSVEGLDASSRRLADLSAAQMRILLALGDGRLNKQIAADMKLTEATVKAHLTAIFRKLGVNNRSQAMLAAQPLLATAGEDAI